MLIASIACAVKKQQRGPYDGCIFYLVILEINNEMVFRFGGNFSKDGVSWEILSLASFYFVLYHVIASYILLPVLAQKNLN